MDSEKVIKGLECHADMTNLSCKPSKCPYFSFDFCGPLLAHDALELLREQQEALTQAQEELLNLQSAQKRGEDHSYTDELTLDVFESAVREFVGLLTEHKGKQALIIGRMIVYYIVLTVLTYR